MEEAGSIQYNRDNCKEKYTVILYKYIISITLGTSIHFALAK